VVYRAFAGGVLLVIAIAAGFMVVRAATPNDDHSSDDVGGRSSSKEPALTPPPLAPTGPNAPPLDPLAVSIGNQGNFYDRTTIVVPRESTITVTFTNSDSEPHDFGVSIPGLAHTEACRGPCSRSLTFNTGAPATYSFQCTIHAEMVGELTVY
jgi:Cupredoxin-like domain